MQIVNGLPEQEANKVASRLLSRLTPDNVLQTEAEVDDLPGAYVRVNVAFADRYNEKWFDITVLWLDTKTNAYAFIQSAYPVEGGVPVIRPEVYEVILQKGRSKQYRASGMNTFAYDVYTTIPETQPEHFAKPITRAMQIMQRVESILKHLFEE